MSEVHRWTDRYGQTWECDAYDHGPLCRRCRLVPVPDDQSDTALSAEQGPGPNDSVVADRPEVSRG